MFNKQQIANKVENQFLNQKQKLTNYSIDFVNDFSQQISQIFLFISNRVVKFLLFLNKLRYLTNVIIVNNNYIATIKKITNSKKKRIIKSKSNFITISSGFVSKSTLFTHYLRVAVKKAHKRRKISEQINFDSNEARFLAIDIQTNESIKSKKKATRQREKKKTLKSIVKIIDRSNIDITKILLT